MSRKVIYYALTAAGSIAVGSALLKYTLPGSTELQPRAPRQSNDQRERLKALLEQQQQPDRTIRDKLEAAHDGAVRTHWIGFPRNPRGAAEQ